MLALFESSKKIFLVFHKTSWTQKLNYQHLLVFDLLVFGHLALAVHGVLWMPSSATLLSQCFLREVLFPEDSHKERERKNFSAIGWTWQGCQLSPTECEIHQNGLDPPLLLFASCACRESQNIGDCSILFEKIYITMFPMNENAQLSLVLLSIAGYICPLAIWANKY